MGAPRLWCELVRGTPYWIADGNVNQAIGTNAAVLIFALKETPIGRSTGSFFF